MSSQHPAFYFGGQASNMQPPTAQNYAQAPPSTNGTPMTPSQPQQMAYQQNAALPGIDMSALNGINISPEQLMIVARLIQSGQLALPPPAPASNSTPSALLVSAPNPLPVAAPHVAPPPDRQENDVDMDREEGELEDEEDALQSHVMSSTARTPHLTDSSVAAQDTQANGLLTSHTAPHMPQTSNGVVHAQSTNGAEPRTSVSESNTGAQPSVAVKAFVLEMHKNGYGFEDLAREVGNTQALRKLYEQIGLPIPSAQTPSSSFTRQSIAPSATSTGASTADAHRQIPGKPAATAPATKTLTAAAKPDRASYLAKLQAAKNKKSETATESPTGNAKQSPALSAVVNPASSAIPPQSAAEPRPPESLISAVPQSAAGAAVPQPMAATAADPPRAAGSARPTPIKVDHELLKQKIAKLNADRAAAREARRLSGDVSTSNGTNSQAVGDRFGQNQRGLPTQYQAATSSTPTGPTSSPVVADRGFTHPLPPPISAAASPSIARGSGLPGLFTTRTPVQQTSSPAPSPAQATAAVFSKAIPTQSPAASPLPLNNPRQRPHNGQQPSWNGAAASTRPFGGSGMQQEPVIIETSGDDDDDDDDDDGEDMDTDDSTDQQLPETKAQQPPARPVGLIPDFPPKVNIQRGSSTPGTPGLDLKRKLEEIEATKQRIQKAEELKRRKVNVQPAANIQAAQPPGAVLTARSSVSLSDAATPNAEQRNQSPLTRNLSVQQEKEALQKRLQELQSSLAAKLPGSTTAPVPAVEVPMQAAPGRSEEQSSGAAVADDEDDADDGDLYDTAPANLTQGVETSAPEAGVEANESDDDAEFYEPEEPSSNGEDAPVQPSSDNGRIGSQATTQSATTNADAANTQLTAEMDAAMTDDVDVEVDDAESAAPAQQESEPSIVDAELNKDGVALATAYEDIIDDDSENMYEPSLDVEPTTTDPARSPSKDVVMPAEVEESSDEQDDGNESMDISDDSDSDSSSDESSDDYEPEQTTMPEAIDLPEAPEAPDNVQAHDQDASDVYEPAHTTIPDEFDLPESPHSVQGHVQEPSEEQANLRVDDDLAPELQPAAEQHVVVDEPAPAPTSGFYKPYTSVLSKFKEFRYHPSFIDTVPGGHKSLTYSNKIESDNPICPYEIGGRCNDKECKFQHFRTMTLSDNDLLREIGTRKIPAKGQEEEKKWRDGLTAVVHELRSTNRGKDVAVIAQRIAEFRREFRGGDPSKTLLLD